MGTAVLRSTYRGGADQDFDEQRKAFFLQHSIHSAPYGSRAASPLAACTLLMWLRVLARTASVVLRSY